MLHISLHLGSLPALRSQQLINDDNALLTKCQVAPRAVSYKNVLGRKSQPSLLEHYFNQVLTAYLTTIIHC